MAIKPYTVTNISEDRLMKLFQTADEGDGYTEWTVPGEGTQGLSYDEYHVDDDALVCKDYGDVLSRNKIDEKTNK